MKLLEAALLAASWGFDLRLGVQPSDTLLPVQRLHSSKNLHRQTRLLVADCFFRVKASSQQVGRTPGNFHFFRRMIMFGNFRFAAVFFCLISASLLHAQTSGSLTAGPSTNLPGQSGGAAKQRPNILFIIMDDVGIDQMQIFGYGGGTPPLTPNINAIAHAGVRFRNVWSMPECSPSRAIFFEGRYPLRTNVNNAILSNDLANSQVSPFEVTTPEILRTKNYKSAMFGKCHLAGPDNNGFTYNTPHVLGWDYFDGFLEGAMHPIDTTIGNQYSTPAGQEPIYSCGFIPNKTRDP